MDLGGFFLLGLSDLGLSKLDLSELDFDDFVKVFFEFEKVIISYRDGR